MKNYKINKAILIKITLLLVLLTIINIIIEKKIIIFLIISSIIIISTVVLLIKKKPELLELKSEIKNITWPDKKEVNQSMLTVTLVISTASFLIWVIDSMLTYIISKII